MSETMTRGDGSRPSAKASGAAIAAVSMVVCLCALTAVLWSSDALRRLTRVWFEPYGGVAEPVPGAPAALRSLSWRSCQEGEGPVVGTNVARDIHDQVHRRALARGYVPADGEMDAAATPAASSSQTREAQGGQPRTDEAGRNGWSDPLPLPLETRYGVPGGCGLIAVVSEASTTISRAEPRPSTAAEAPSPGTARPPPALPEEACSTDFLLIAACDGDAFEVQGNGRVRVRRYAAPGVTIDTIAATGMPVDVALAHAEAAGELARHGWEPADEVVRDVPPATAVTRRPPVLPTAGCTAYVVVGHGYGSGVVYWPLSGPWQSGAPNRLVLGVLACGVGSRSAGYEGSFDYSRVGAPEGSAFYVRAFRKAPTAGPVLPEMDAPLPLALYLPARTVEPHAASAVPETAIAGDEREP